MRLFTPSTSWPPAWALRASSTQGSAVGSAAGQAWRRRRPVPWQYEGKRAVRDGRRNPVSRYPEPWELFDMAEDRVELKDLAVKHDPTVKGLAGAYEELATRCGVLAWGVIRTNLGRGSRPMES